jgi:GAF domain-containing protein
LVLEKSSGYLEAIKQDDAKSRRKTLDDHDNLGRNIQRIIAVFYKFLGSYADLPSGKEFQVAFFAVEPARNTLVLKAILNSDQQPPKSVALNGTNPHLAKDGDSLASLAWRLQSQIIISDTAEELGKPQSRFVRFYDNQERDIRSIVAHPVIDRNLAAFGSDPCIGVICADCRATNSFKTEDEQDLSVLFDTFARRIVFELRRFNCITRLGEVEDGDTDA